MFLASTGKWSQADWNADGVTDGQDFILRNEFKFQSADGAALMLQSPWRDRGREVYGDDTQLRQIRHPLGHSTDQPLVTSTNFFHSVRANRPNYVVAAGAEPARWSSVRQETQTAEESLGQSPPIIDELVRIWSDE